MNTLAFPFGQDDIDTLIVCRNEIHMRNVAKAFKLKAMYTTWFSALTGHRFKYVIVFKYHEQGLNDARRAQQYVDESLRLKLMPEGKLIIV